MSATTTDGTQATGLKGLVREMERVRRHGFLASELERAKVDLLSTYESAWREKDKTESSDFAGQYVGNFLDQEPIPSIDWEYETAHQLVPAITLEEVAGLAKRFIHDDNRVILAQSPEKDGLTPPTEDGLRAALAEATAAPVTPWEDRTAGRGLMDTKPRLPGRGHPRHRRIGVTV
jgi:zinc protease